MTPYAIDQRVVLETGELQNFLVILLPGGKETRAPIDLETTKEFLQKVEYGPSEAEAAPPQEEEEEGTIRRGRLPPDFPVRWKDMPDGELPPIFKAAIARVGVTEEVLPISRVVSLVEQISQRFTQDDWKELAESPGMPMGMAPPPLAPQPPPPAAVPAVPQPKPPLGAVQWADGRPIAPGAYAAARTVPKDDFGYPVVPEGEVDPGEIVGGTDTDEDGVGQL